MTPDPEISPLLTTPEPEATDRRNGKVARLPKLIRDKINLMIQDGVPYLDIIHSLGPDGAALLEKNLSTWKSGGYLDWLRESRLIEAIQAKHGTAVSIVAQAGDDNAAAAAILEVIATNLCEFLVETDPATIRESLLSDADKFTRFVNSMVRLAEGGIKCQIHKFRTQDRSIEAAKQKQTTETPGISEESLHRAEEKLNLL